MEYLNTCGPHPTKKVNSLGDKSRAGLTGTPQFIPKLMPNPIMRNPMYKAKTESGTLQFSRSTIAQAHSNNRADPTICFQMVLAIRKCIGKKEMFQITNRIDNGSCCWEVGRRIRSENGSESWIIFCHHKLAPSLVIKRLWNLEQILIMQNV